MIKIKNFKGKIRIPKTKIQPNFATFVLNQNFSINELNKTNNLNQEFFVDTFWEFSGGTLTTFVADGFSNLPGGTTWAIRTLETTSDFTIVKSSFTHPLYILGIATGGSGGSGQASTYTGGGGGAGGLGWATVANSSVISNGGINVAFGANSVIATHSDGTFEIGNGGAGGSILTSVNGQTGYNSVISGTGWSDSYLQNGTSGGGASTGTGGIQDGFNNGGSGGWFSAGGGAGSANSGGQPSFFSREGHFWKFDENSGATSWYNTWSPSKSFTAVGTITSGITGKYNKAITFAGGYLQRTDLNFSAYTSMSINVWVRRNANAGFDQFQYVFDTREVGVGGLLLLIDDDSSYRPFLNCEAGNLFADVGTVMDLGVWRMLTVTWDGNQLKLYVDSVLQLETLSESQINDTTFSLRMGSNSRSGLPNGASNISLEECKIFDFAITQDQITSIYNDGFYFSTSPGDYAGGGGTGTGLQGGAWEQPYFEILQPGAGGAGGSSGNLKRSGGYPNGGQGGSSADNDGNAPAVPATTGGLLNYGAGGGGGGAAAVGTNLGASGGIGVIGIMYQIG